MEGSLGVLEKLEQWFHPSHYTIMEVKMAVVKEWGDKVGSHKLGMGDSSS